MLAKLTSKNQITIPKKIIEQLPGARYFDVSLEDGKVILRPITLTDTSLDQIRDKIKALELDENLVAEAIKWARESQKELS